MLTIGITVSQEAAQEKAGAGEGRNVEHVAEADDLTHVKKRQRKQPAKSKQQTEDSQTRLKADVAKNSNQRKRQRKAKADTS